MTMPERPLQSWWEAADHRDWTGWEVEAMKIGYPSFRRIIRRRYADPRRFLGWNIPQSTFCGFLDRLGCRFVEGLGWELPETFRERVEREECGEWVLAWRGKITPFPADMALPEIQMIVSDLSEGRPVRVDLDGTLRHYPQCGGTHRPAPQHRLQRRLRGTFSVELAHRIPPGLPIVRSLSPAVTASHPLGKPPHLLNGIEALCVIFPPDRAWVAGRDSARDFLNFSAMWFAKHLAWEESRERGVGVDAAWPGPFASHDPFELATVMQGDHPCRCGSPKLYRDCCAEGDEQARAQAPRVRTVKGPPPSHSRPLRSNASLAQVATGDGRTNLI